jgi:hypothetical protein
MPALRWLTTLGALLALGLLASGCGGETTTVTVGPSTTSTSGSSTSSASTTASGTTPESVYNDCIDAINGTPAESTGQRTCEQTRDVLEQCIQQAQSVPQAAQASAIRLCDSAAQQAIDALKASGG